ncbi:hypothetical protein K402DRAFT_421367 [Aulographum hederae CBS 113979]|uniref:Uncharacterized protein n=1 Tax=Aulographum hederae CBS 113979 TaxID=1176131 RepID=A0A6G1GZJ5_9PEZI|nr:hypothetical protein K402DRAFT_421367 [Aulographum hederae CBS 113979]
MADPGNSTSKPDSKEASAQPENPPPENSVDSTNPSQNTIEHPTPSDSASDMPPEPPPSPQLARWLQQSSDEDPWSFRRHS